jgi:hypothetical protein
MRERTPRYLLGWRDICRSTDERTAIASVIPLAAVGNNVPVQYVAPKFSGRLMAALQGNLSALVRDFAARHKVGGTRLNFFVYKQLPVLPPDTYSETDLDYIVPRVLHLHRRGSQALRRRPRLRGSALPLRPGASPPPQERAGRLLRVPLWPRPRRAALHPRPRRPNRT